MKSILRKPDQILYTQNEKPSFATIVLLGITHIALIFDAVVFLIVIVLYYATRIILSCAECEFRSMYRLYPLYD